MSTEPDDQTKLKHLRGFGPITDDEKVNVHNFHLTRMMCIDPSSQMSVSFVLEPDTTAKERVLGCKHQLI